MNVDHFVPIAQNCHLYVSRKLWPLLPKLFNFLSVWMLFFVSVLIKV